MRKRSFLCVALTTVFLFCLTACSGSVQNVDTAKVSESAQPETAKDSGSDEYIVLKLYTHYDSGDTNKRVEYCTEKVQEKYPNVSFEIDPYQQDGGQSIKARAATGDLPDILFLNDGSILPLAKSGSILTLDDYIEKNDYTSGLSQSAIDNCLYSSDGHIYQFPVNGVQPYLWYYNKDLFDQYNVKVPENFDELLTAIQTFRDNDIIPMALFAKEPWVSGTFFDAFAMKEAPGGLKALSEGTAKASDEGYKKAIHKMKQAIDAGIFQQGVTNADFDTAFALFSSGKAAMFQNGDWCITDINKQMDDNVDYFDSYPTNDADYTDNNGCFAGGGNAEGYGVAANTADPELAMDVAALFAKAQAEYDYVKNGLVNAPFNTENLIPEVELPDMSKKMGKQLSEMKFTSKNVEMISNREFGTAFPEELQKFIVGESEEDFIKAVDALVEKAGGQ